MDALNSEILRNAHAVLLPAIGDLAIEPPLGALATPGQVARSIMTRLPDSDFLHRLADLADLETLRRFRRPLVVDSKSG